MTRIHGAVLISAVAMGLVAGSGVTGLASPPNVSRLARARLGPAPAQLNVTSAAFASGAEIPYRHTNPAEHWSPPLAWSGQPANTQTFVVVVEDSDARHAWQAPYVVWLLFNIEGSRTSLPEGVPSGTILADYGWAHQGRTSGNSVGYFGPQLSAGEPAHRLHFQVFALDRGLYVMPGSSLDEVAESMRGSVIAHGELVGMTQRIVR